MSDTTIYEPYMRALKPKASTPGAGIRRRRERLSVRGPSQTLEREIIIDNLLVRIHLIIEMILVDRPCAMGV